MVKTKGYGLIFLNDPPSLVLYLRQKHTLKASSCKDQTEKLFNSWCMGLGGKNDRRTKKMARIHVNMEFPSCDKQIRMP